MNTADRVRKIPEKGELEWNNIYAGDSLEGMRRLDDASIDLVMTSPPYADMKRKVNGLGRRGSGAERAHILYARVARPSRASRFYRRTCS